LKVRTPEERRAYYAKRKAQGRPIKSGPSGKCGPRHPIGIDGEGVTDKNGNHRYVMLTYSDATGENAGTVEAKLGEHLTTDECFDFLWQMFQDNPHALFFGFSLGYDWSKIYEDMSNQAIYQLYRPETRAFMPGGKKRWPVKYKDWRINLDGPQCTKIQLKGYKPPFKKWHK